MYDTILSSENKLIQRTLKAGAEYCDLRYESVVGTALEMKERELRNVIPGRNSGAILRALVNGSWGIISFNEESTLRNAPDIAVRFAKASGVGNTSLAESDPIRDRIIWKPKTDPEDISLEEKYSLVKDVNSRVMDIDGIQGITSGYSDSTILKRLITSEGTEVEYQMCIGHIQSRIIAKKESRILGYRTRVGATGGFEIFAMDDPVEKALDGAKSVLDILSARSSPSGRMTVVTDNDLTGVFAHEAIGHATEGDLIVSGESILKGRIGEVVASECVSLIDDPTIPGGFGSYPIDDEGLRSQRKTLISEGVLTDYILNRQTARELGMTPNGGARAQSYSSQPLVRMSNTMIEGGDMSFEELIEDIDHGVYAKGTRGGQVDTVQGSFQFSAQQAYLIEKGEVTIQLRDVSLSGMTLEIMRNIDGVGKDAKLGDPGFCGKGQMVPVGDGGPHIRIRNAIVGGGV
jgi:TldD protein